MHVGEHAQLQSISALYWSHSASSLYTKWKWHQITNFVVKCFTIPHLYPVCTLSCTRTSIIPMIQDNWSLYLSNTELFGHTRHLYIYIYAFSRHFYPKRLTIAFRLYIFICVPWESNPQPFALLTQCSTTEPHRNTFFLPLSHTGTRSFYHWAT